MNPALATLFLLLAWTTGRAALPECEKPDIPEFDDASYYARTVDLEGDKLKAKLNETITHGDIQSLDCAGRILAQLPGAGDAPPVYVWPRERGFPNDIQDAYSDLYNLLPARPAFQASGGDSRKWRIPDRLKGDIARVILYMDTRYDGDDASLTPDLALTRGPAPANKNSLGRLCDFLEWHRQDPVDATEKQRNDLIWQWQGNRNPYVDHPELVTKVWQVDCSLPDISDREGLLKRIEQLEKELHAIKRQLMEES